MEDLGQKIFMIVLVILVIGGCIFGYKIFSTSVDYYTQIDNSKIQKVNSSDEMKYEYTLKAYKKDGKEKEVKFKTSRELRDTAYLKLKVIPITGVNKWEEVQYNELPEKVKAVYSEQNQ